MNLKISANFFKRKDLWLWTIISLGLVVRIFGINFYLPFHMHLDENNIFDKAFQIIKNHDLNTHYYRYPALLPYLQAVVYTMYLVIVKIFSFSGATLPELMERNVGSLFIIGRGISVAAGTATLYVTYLISRRLFSRMTALVATLFLSLTFIHVVLSHYLVTDALMILFGTSAFYYSTGPSIDVEKKKPWKYLLVGALIGLANATKYNPFYLIFLCGPFLSLWKEKEDKRIIFFRSLKGFCWGFLAFVAAFFIFNPYMLFEFSNYIKGITSQLLLFRGEEISTFSNVNGFTTWKWWLEYLPATGISYTMFPLSVMGFFLLFRADLRRINYMLLIFPLVYCLFIFTVPHRADRYIGPVLPFFAIYAGLFFEFIYQLIHGFFKNKTFLKIPIIAVLIIFIFTWPLVKVLAFDYLISQKDTRLIAAKYIEKNVSKRTMIFAVAETSPIGHYLQSKGFRAINFHESTFGNLNWLPFNDINVLDYPNSIVVVNMKDYYETKNYNNMQEFAKFQIDYKHLKSKAILLKEITKPLFKSGFFAPFHLIPSATTHTYHNPTIQIFKIPHSNLSEPPRISVLTGEELSQLYGIPLIIDAGYEKVAELSLEGVPSINGPHLPFPAGRYQVSFELKFENAPKGTAIAEMKVHHSGLPQLLYGHDTIAASGNSDDNKAYKWYTMDFVLKDNDRLEFVLIVLREKKCWVKTMKVELLDSIPLHSDGVF